MKCTNCGRGNVFFGETCSYCATRNHDNTQSLDGLWGRFKSKEKAPDKPRKPKKSFFRPIWAIPFKLLWLPVRLLWWSFKSAF